LPKNDSIKFNQDPCLGVKVNSNQLGSVARKARVSWEDVCVMIVEHDTDAGAGRVMGVGQSQEFDEFHAPMPLAYQAQDLARQEVDTSQ
jgi:hypothetical protein